MIFPLPINQIVLLTIQSFSEPSTAAANNLEAAIDLEPEQGDDVDVEPER
jgi:hypothetical protein